MDSQVTHHSLLPILISGYYQRPPQERLSIPTMRRIPRYIKTIQNSTEISRYHKIIQTTITGRIAKILSSRKYWLDWITRFVTVRMLTKHHYRNESSLLAKTIEHSIEHYLTYRHHSNMSDIHTFVQTYLPDYFILLILPLLNGFFSKLQLYKSYTL